MSDQDQDTIKNILNLIGAIISPFCLIWSLNQLFELNINYSFSNWIASLLMLLFIKSSNNNH